jgi:phospholipase C
MTDARISHIFVLMLENRSFDHVFGFSGIPGIDGLNGSESNPDTAHGTVVRASATAALALAPDPPHEYQNVVRQLHGTGGDASAAPAMSGFIDSYADAGRKTAASYVPADIMRCQAAASVPVMTALAREFAVCDRYFSSLPGPTWPNRFFVHAASSGGLFRSPSAAKTLSSELLGVGFTFQNGTIYDRLDAGKRWWRVYHGDDLPQVQAIAGMTARRLFTDHFERYEAFAADVAKADYPFAYTFIEPNYGHVATADITSDFRGGNSAHPVGSIADGERLIKEVYEAIRASPIWASSLLIISCDEHGGFYDHVVPPPAPPPGDAPINASLNPPEDPSIGGILNSGDFAFDRYGLRVPALVISPYVARGTVAHQTFDHGSVVATVLRAFDCGNLTARDRQASDLLGLLTLQQPRQDAPLTLPEPATATAAPVEAAADALPVPAQGPLDPGTAAFLHLAAQTDLQLSAIPEQVQLVDRIQGIDSQQAALSYIGEVKAKMAYHDSVAQAKGLGSLETPNP